MNSGVDWRQYVEQIPIKKNNLFITIIHYTARYYFVFGPLNKYLCISLASIDLLFVPYIQLLIDNYISPIVCASFTV